ncbi:MAG TPA: Gmad2 immunoglobulin-like domain-containing protein [Gaiellaceae bacterium]|nr:Gmad2 immunoglobulin-like domain-containing protein [Gaiellaceae bacterium]
MVRPGVLLLVAVTVAAGCGGAAADETEAPRAPAAYALYYLDGEQVRAYRAEAETAPTVREAVEALVANAEGRATAIPPGTRVRGLETDGAEAVVDLSSAFARGGGSLGMQARVAQVVATLTQWPRVERVTIRIDGADVEAIGGEGVPARDLTRADVGAVLAPIVVDRPLAGTEASSPLLVRGSASVFEANVSLRLEAEGGAVLAEGFATAAEGAPGRGDFAQELPFEVDEPTEATLVLYEESADDGSERHAVRVPLRLCPAGGC